MVIANPLIGIHDNPYIFNIGDLHSPFAGTKNQHVKYDFCSIFLFSDIVSVY